MLLCVILHRDRHQNENFMTGGSGIANMIWGLSVWQQCVGNSGHGGICRDQAAAKSGIALGKACNQVLQIPKFIGGAGVCSIDTWFKERSAGGF